MEERFSLDIVEVDNSLAVSPQTVGVALALLEKTKVFEIQNDSDKRRATEIRAGLNKIIKEIDRTRIDKIADLTQIFTEQCNNLKELFNERQKEFGDAIKQYTDSKKAVLGADTPLKKCILTIKTSNSQAVEEITKLCIKYSCDLTIK